MPPGAILAIVPGACYREYPQTGADGRRLVEDARRHGWPVETVPVPSFGSPATNGGVVCDWLRDRPEETIVLVSLSKGSADLRAAFARPDAAEAFRNVAVWVSLSGIVLRLGAGRLVPRPPALAIGGAADLLASWLSVLDAAKPWTAGREGCATACWNRLPA